MRSSNAAGAETDGRQEPQSLSGVLEQLSNASDEKSISFGDVVDAFGQRAYGPLLLVPAIIAVAPTGAIPGMSIITGSIIVLIAGQLLVGRTAPWLPSSLLGFTFSRERLDSAIATVCKTVSFIDRFLKPRLAFMVGFPADRLVAGLCILFAASMFPLALLPFAVAIPGTAIAIIALGLTARDGLLVLLGIVAGLATLGAALVWGTNGSTFWF